MERLDNIAQVEEVISVGVATLASATEVRSENQPDTKCYDWQTPQAAQTRQTSSTTNREVFPHINVVATGRNIEALMSMHGMTVKDVQGYLGLSAPQAVYRWYWGKALPSLDHLFALSKLLGVSMESILIEQDQDAPSCTCNSCHNNMISSKLNSWPGDAKTQACRRTRKTTYYHIAIEKCIATVSTSRLHPRPTRIQQRSWINASNSN
jgi:hypothetical protein